MQQTEQQREAVLPTGKLGNVLHGNAIKRKEQFSATTAARDHGQNSISAPNSSLFSDQRGDAPHANETGDPGEDVQFSPRKPGMEKTEETQACSANSNRGIELLPAHTGDTKRHTDFNKSGDIMSRETV